MKLALPEEDVEILQKRNRHKKLAPKKHKIANVSGRSTKQLWSVISQKKTKKDEK